MIGKNPSLHTPGCFAKIGVSFPLSVSSMISTLWKISLLGLGLTLSVPASSWAQAAKTTKPAAKTPDPKSAVGKPAPIAKTGAQGSVGPSALPRIYAPTRPREVAPKYPWKEKIPSTIFWIGEVPTEGNPVPNHQSSWDPNWQINYGGFDDPNPANRSWNFCPKNFTPKLNPFYIALPFNDVQNREIAKLKIPWHKAKWTGDSHDTVCENRWLAIRSGSKVCYAQWSDCGPFNTTDHDYVFGSARPKNLENEGAGLDVSPAVRDFLGINSGALCDWRFVEESEVPDGPWKRFGKNNAFVKNEDAELAKLRAEYQQLVKKRDDWLNNNIKDYRNNARPR